MSKKGEEAKRCFQEGANCSQAVFCTFSGECGLDKKLAEKLASGFGGGIARMREVCGAVTGMCMAADMLWGFGTNSTKEEKDAHYALLQKLAGRFREVNGSIVCRELLGLAAGENAGPVSTPRTPEFHKKRPCGELVAMAAEILAEEISARNAVTKK